MQCPKPCNAGYKNSVVVYLALKAQFSIADNHSKEKNLSELGKTMHLHVFNSETEPWKENIILHASHLSKITQLLCKLDSALRELQIAKDEEQSTMKHGFQRYGRHSRKDGKR